MIPAMRVWRRSLVCAGALLVLAVPMTTGGAGAWAAGSTEALSSGQVLDIALQQAKNSDDARPVDIRMASGPLETALKIESLGSTSYPPTSPSGPAAPGDANSTVYLVALRGRFVHPRGLPGEAPASSHVLELIIDANGFVQSLGYMSKVPVALSHLGPVTQLHYPGEPTAARR
jgi:hypothetical protein